MTPKIQADSGTEWAIGPAKRLLARLKAQGADLRQSSLKRVYDLGNGVMAYLQIGEFVDRIRITGGGRILSGSPLYNYTQEVYWGEREDSLAAMRVSSTGTATGIVGATSFASGNRHSEWAKGYSTVGVTLTQSTSIELIRGDVHQVIADVGVFPSNYFGGTKYRNLVGMDKFGISNDGKTVLLRGMSMSSLLKAAQWNQETSVFDVSSVGFPDEVQQFMGGAAPATFALLGDTDSDTLGITSTSHEFIGAYAGGVPVYTTRQYGSYPRFWLNPFSGTEVYVEFDLQYANLDSYLGDNHGYFSSVNYSVSSKLTGQWLYQVWKYDALTDEWTKVYDRGTEAYIDYTGYGYEFTHTSGGYSTIVFEPTSRQGSRISWDTVDYVATPRTAYLVPQQVIADYPWATFQSVDMVATVRTTTTLMRDGVAWVENVPVDPTSNGQEIVVNLGDDGRGVVNYWYGQYGTPSKYIWRAGYDEPVDPDVPKIPEVRGDNYKPVGTAYVPARISRSGKRLYTYDSSTLATMRVDGVKVWELDTLLFYHMIRTSFKADAKFQVLDYEGLGISACSINQNSEGVWELSGKESYPGKGAFIYYRTTNPDYNPDAATPEAITAQIAQGVIDNGYSSLEEMMADDDLTMNDVVEIATSALTGQQYLNHGPGQDFSIILDEYIP